MGSFEKLCKWAYSEPDSSKKFLHLTFQFRALRLKYLGFSDSFVNGLEGVLMIGYNWFPASILEFFCESCCPFFPLTNGCGFIGTVS